MSFSTSTPLSGVWQPTQLSKMLYGPSAVQTHLKTLLPTPTSKAFIITGQSLANKTPLISQVEELLTTSHHAGTFSKIGEHAPVAQLDDATSKVQADSSIDTIISIGGGSPIDSAKAISHRCHEKTGNWLFHICIPTTLSAAECSFLAGYTQANGLKTGLRAPEIGVSVIIYDAKFADYTPEKLFLSTGIRALDHAIELLYNEGSAESPCKGLCLSAIHDLFVYLPKYKEDPKNEDFITKCQLAAFSSLYGMGEGVKGGIGLSHSLGYALGSPYGIPHGITSCLTLGKVVMLKAENPVEAREVARALDVIPGGKRTGDDRADAVRVGKEIEGLVERLGLKTTLSNYGVGKEEVPKVVKLGTGKEEGEVYEKVSELVSRLF